LEHLAQTVPGTKKTFSYEETTPVFFLDRYIEGLVDELQLAIGADDIVSAKEEFFIQFGKVFPDDEIFEQRMSLFSEWLVMKKRWPKFEHETFLSTCRTGQSPIVQFFYSVFLIQKSTESSISVYDFYSKKKFVVRVKPSEKFVALSKGSLIQGFIFETEEGIFLGSGLIDHPQSITRTEKKVAERTIKDEASLDEYMCDLARIHLKHFRHNHVDARKIYDPKTR
jgi:hypothetical protein